MLCVITTFITIQILHQINSCLTVTGSYCDIIIIKREYCVDENKLNIFVWK